MTTASPVSGSHHGSSTVAPTSCLESMGEWHLTNHSVSAKIIPFCRDLPEKCFNNDIMQAITFLPLIIIATTITIVASIVEGVVRGLFALHYAGLSFIPFFDKDTKESLRNMGGKLYTSIFSSAINEGIISTPTNCLYALITSVIWPILYAACCCCDYK